MLLNTNSSNKYKKIFKFAEFKHCICLREEVKLKI